MPKYPKVEEDLFPANTSGYVLDLDKSTNASDSIRVWIGALYHMQITAKLDNHSIFTLAEKRMTGIVYDWWMTPPPDERMVMAAQGLATLETLLKTQFVPEPTDERKQIMIDMTRMELKDLRYLEQFGHEYFRLVMKEQLSNDLPTKISFLSKLPNNIGDLVIKDLENKGKFVEGIY